MVFMSRLAIVAFAGVSSLILGALVSSHSIEAQAPTKVVAYRNPQACYFFKKRWTKVPGQDIGPPAYNERVLEMYRCWCISKNGGSEDRKKAANEMTIAWKNAWDNTAPYYSTFHEIGAFDLLALMGITHEFPGPLASDPSLRGTWIENCRDNCFHLDGNPLDPSDGRFMLMQLWLRNDVLDNLKREPAAEPVLKMLRDAKFSLVD
jgi:hypothetical protein